MKYLIESQDGVYEPVWRANFKSPKIDKSPVIFEDPTRTKSWLTRRSQASHIVKY